LRGLIPQPGRPTAIAAAEWGDQRTLFVGAESGELIVPPIADADWR